MSDGITVVVHSSPGEDVRPGIRQLMENIQYVVINSRCMDELQAQTGGITAALSWLTEQSRELGRPVGINTDKPDGTSQTTFLAPGWSPEKLRGWLAMAMPFLEETFGPITQITDPAMYHDSKPRHPQDANENDKGET